MNEQGGLVDRILRSAQDETKRKDMISRLEKAEKQHDFYAGLYRQYSTDLMKMVFYVRKLLTNAKVVTYMEANHRETLSQFREIVFEDGGGDRQG